MLAYRDFSVLGCQRSWVVADQDVGVSGCCRMDMSVYQNVSRIRMSVYRDVGVSRCWHIRMSSYQAVGVLVCRQIRMSAYKDVAYQGVGVSGCWHIRMLVCR